MFKQILVTALVGAVLSADAFAAESHSLSIDPVPAISAETKAETKPKPRTDPVVDRETKDRMGSFEIQR